ncbi:MAG: hypothetical protein GOP50_05845 [Candidatus Heimdallarchaeota archaeon]|nr:hypothetical protein [Candidatus Heimdallarchaeota archaeon]
MNSKKKEQLEDDYTQEELFYKEAERVYVPMSDGAELLTYFTKKGNHPKGYEILFIPGYSSVPMSWNDLWDCLNEHFNLYVFETREKITSKVKWKHKGDMNRSGLDVKEVFEGLKLDPKKTIIYCACSSALYVARALAEEWIKPLAVIMVGAVRTPKLPTKLVFLTHFTPSFVINGLLRVIGKIWISTVIKEGVQRERYKQYIGTASAMRWKKTSSITWWDGTEDFKKIDTPTLIVGAVEEDLHEDNESQICVDLVSTSEYLQVPSFLYMHHLPGAVEFTKQMIEYIDKL